MTAIPKSQPFSANTESKNQWHSNCKISKIAKIVLLSTLLNAG